MVGYLILLQIGAGEHQGPLLECIWEVYGDFIQDAEPLTVVV